MRRPRRLRCAAAALADWALPRPGAVANGLQNLPHAASGGALPAVPRDDHPAATLFGVNPNSFGYQLGGLAYNLVTIAADGVAALKAAKAARALKDADGIVGAAKNAVRRLAGGCKPGNSFTLETRVLLADGSAKPIKDLHPGDTVLAGDTTTGTNNPEKVVAVIDGHGTKHLTTLTIKTTKGTTSTITATDGHPFWVPAKSAWLSADKLKVGDRLQTSAGTHVQIAAVRHSTVQAAVRNLTVAQLHTYYVVAGGTPILVHNSCGPDKTSVVYRSDTRDPSVIFNEGFQPKGGNMNLEEHVAGVSGVYTEESGFVATTTSESHALARRGNTFVIDRAGISGGVDVNGAIPDNVDAHEMELAVPHGIDSCHIQGCWLEGSGEWLPNPNYGGGSSG